MGRLRCCGRTVFRRASTSQVARAKGATARLMLRERDDAGRSWVLSFVAFFRGDRKQAQAWRQSRESAIEDSKHAWKLGQNEDDDQLQRGAQSLQVPAVLRFA